MDWFSIKHGTASDAKLTMISRKIGVRRCEMTAVWLELMDYASQKTPLGCVMHCDLELIAFNQEIPLETVYHIYNSLVKKSIIINDFLTNWENWSPQKTRLSGNVWRILRLKIFERDNFTCQYCGCSTKKLECDHIIPVSRGGGNEESNLLTACFQCNRAKKDKLPQEWRSHAKN